MATKKDAEGGSTSTRDGSGMKKLLVLLLVLDVAALGTWGYLRFKKARDARSVRARCVGQLTTVKRNGEQLSQAVEELKQNRTSDVSDPTAPVIKVLEQAGLMDNVEFPPSTSSTFRPIPSYDEHLVKVRIKNKTGVPLDQFVGVLKHIEKQNQKMQIKSVDFGNRDNDERSYWHPAEFEVRVFKPKPET